MSDELERRLVALESRITHHERMAEELSDVLARQQRAIDLLTAQLSLLKDRVRDQATAWSPSPQDEKPPPHY